MGYKRIIIIGKGGSGKDHLRKEMVSHGFKYCVSHTSRPIREGEKEGEDYYFVDESHFSSGIFYEKVIFNGWFYGTSMEEFRSSNLFIMTPSGLAKMPRKDREQSHVIYLDIDEDTRRERLSKRRDADDVERRLKADEIDFGNFSDFDRIIKNPDFRFELGWIDLEKIKIDG